MNLKRADILQPQTLRGSIKISAELRNRVDVGSLGRRRKIADRHVLDHATPQRADLGHLKASCLGVGCDTQILSDRRPITRPRRIPRDSGFVESAMTHISGFERSQLLLSPEAIHDYVAADNPVAVERRSGHGPAATHGGAGARILEVEKINVVADKGYFRTEDIVSCEEAGLTPYVPRAAAVSQKKILFPKKGEG